MWQSRFPKYAPSSTVPLLLVCHIQFISSLYQFISSIPHSKLLQPGTHTPSWWGQSFVSTDTCMSTYFILMLSAVKLSLKKYGDKCGWNTAFLTKFTTYFVLLQKLRQTSDKRQHWNVIGFLWGLQLLSNIYLGYRGYQSSGWQVPPSQHCMKEWPTQEAVHYRLHFKASCYSKLELLKLNWKHWAASCSNSGGASQEGKQQQRSEEPV